VFSDSCVSAGKLVFRQVKIEGIRQTHVGEEKKRRIVCNNGHLVHISALSHLSSKSRGLLVQTPNVSRGLHVQTPKVWVLTAQC
jgi:hypothetical protein